MTDQTDRRALMGALAVAAFGIPLAACSPAQVSQLETTVTNIINKVQTGVVAAVSAACAWAGKKVPTAETVMAEIVAALGSPVATVLEGTAAAAISTIAGGVQASIDAIANAGLAMCPPQPPSPTPAPPPAPMATAPVKTKKGTPVVFY